MQIVVVIMYALFLSTLSLRRATRRHRGNDRSPIYFYPRSPCGERPMMPLMGAILILFLSTLSLRRATISARRGARESIDFYPRSPCGERRSGSQHPDGTTNFYPRSPCGERQTDPLDWYLMILISIHALLAESDSYTQMRGGRTFRHFYPRSPCGERRICPGS